MNIIDFHVDTLMRLYELKNKGEKDESLWGNKGCIDFARLIESNYTAQFFACFLDIGTAPVKDSHYKDALAMIDIFYEETEKHREKVAFAGSYEDYEKNKSEGKLSGFLTVEEGDILEGKLERLDELYTKGIRAITLTWNYENCLGYPNHKFKFQNNGLKPFGIEALEKMNCLGIIADVSHLSDGGFEDVYKHSKRPFIATHSNSRSVHMHNRNLTDEMLKKLAERGGVTGLNFAGPFLEPSGRSTVEAMLRHLRHIINVAGRDVVCLGSDFDGIGGELEIKGAQDMPLIAEAMERKGFTSDEIERICYRNAENFLKNYFGS